MAWISVAVSDWQQCADYLAPTGEGAGTVNAISCTISIQKRTR